MSREAEQQRREMMDGTSRRAGNLIELSGSEGWKEHAPGTAYRCPVTLREEAGRFTAAAITLPGVSATGATEREALDNVAAELAAAARRYRAAGESIPWSQGPERTSEGIRWVFFYP
jgi:hypothetical protein